MQNFVRSHAFIHDDSVPGADFDEYSMHPAILGASVLVTNSARFFGDLYRRRLLELDCWPQTLIEPREITLSPLFNLLEDTDACTRFVEIVVSRRLDISSFYSNRKELLDLQSKISAAGGCAGVRPSRNLAARSSSRTEAMAMLRNLGMPTLPGMTCHVEADLQTARGLLGDQIIIKQDCVPPFLWSGPDLPAGSLAFPLYAEAYVTIVSSPNLQWMSWNGFGGRFVCDQIVKCLRHVGNRSLVAGTITEVANELEPSVQRMCETFEFEGPIGLDAVFTQEGNLYVVDLNARFNSCTYPAEFIRRQFPGSCPGFIYEQVGIAVDRLDDICLHGGFKMFESGLGCGSLLVGPSATAPNGPAQAAFLLSIADDASRLDDLHQANLAVILSFGR